MTVGKELRALRKRRGWSLRTFGDLCGISGDELGRYERGEKNPREKNTRKIAEALGEPIQVIRNGLAWVEDDTLSGPEDAPSALRKGILQFLREAYGSVDADTFVDGLGAERTYYTVGTTESFFLYEEDLAALEASITAAAIPLAEHLKDIRPEPEIQRELLEGLGQGTPDEQAYRLTDGQWAELRELFPPENAGRGRACKDNRLMLEGILYWMRTGIAWRHLPKRFGRARCVYDRLRLWNRTGVWPKVLARMLERGMIDEASIVVDSTHFPDTEPGAKDDAP